jgi:hypothetical protein
VWPDEEVALTPRTDMGRQLDGLVAVDVDPLWCIVLEGFDPQTERVRGALMALADGRVGVGGLRQRIPCPLQRRRT